MTGRIRFLSLDSYIELRPDLRGDLAPVDARAFLANLQQRQGEMPRLQRFLRRAHRPVGNCRCQHADHPLRVFLVFPLTLQQQRILARRQGEKFSIR